MLSYHARRSLNEDFAEIASPSQVDGVWLHGVEVTEEEVAQAIRQYKLDSNIVHDVLDTNELPRIEYDEAGTLYVFLRTPWRVRSGEVKTAPLLAIASSTNYVTLSQSKISHPAEMVDKHPRIATQDSLLLLLATFAAVVSDYEALIHHTSSVVRTTKYRLRKREATNEDFYRFITIEENLSTYNYNLTAMLSVAERLHEDSRAVLSHRHLEALDDIILHIRQLRASVASSSHAVASLYNVYSTVANNLLNQRMKVLTIVTLVVTVPNVFYGMYGMNIALPFAKEPWAYGAIVLFTLIVMILVLILVRRSKLL